MEKSIKEIIKGLCLIYVIGIIFLFILFPLVKETMWRLKIKKMEELGEFKSEFAFFKVNNIAYMITPKGFIQVMNAYNLLKINDPFENKLEIQIKKYNPSFRPLFTLNTSTDLYQIKVETNENEAKNKVMSELNKIKQAKKNFLLEKMINYPMIFIIITVVLLLMSIHVYDLTTK